LQAGPQLVGSLFSGPHNGDGSLGVAIRIIAALDDGMSKAAVCRNFGVKRTTLIETLARMGKSAASETVV